MSGEESMVESAIEGRVVERLMAQLAPIIPGRETVPVNQNVGVPDRTQLAGKHSK